MKSSGLGFDYELPPDRIAQEPPTERDGAKMLVLSRGDGAHLRHRQVVDLPELLVPGDLLVVNRSRVFPARLRAEKLSGGRVEILLLAEADPGSGVWLAMAKPMRRLREGEELQLLSDGSPSGHTLVIRGVGEGTIEVGFPSGLDVTALAEEVGETPLPPYILRPTGPRADDRERYQTVFAREVGSVAAPTAGLHLSEALLGDLRRKGVEVAEVVLHVGPATFLAGQPGREKLAVEPERYRVPEETVDAIRSRQGQRRVIAVGTTTTRALESAARQGWPSVEQATDLVITPGTSFLAIDGLLTNFHLPGSSLLAMICAFLGTPLARKAYEEALAHDYRFYSFGDAMLALP